MATTLKDCNQIDVVDLGENPQLTEKSLVPFLQELCRKGLTKLGLDHCLRQALPPGIRLTMQRIMELLNESTGLQHLQSLNLSGIMVSMREQAPLCHAIQQHPALLEVCLADMGIAGSTATKCISELLTSTTIRSLDLSWNTFSSETFKVLGECILHTDCLKSLAISSCAGSGNGADNPCAFFLEYLAQNQTITQLDISMNRITFRGALVLEDALMKNRRLSKVNLSGNPLGVLGKRGILRLLSYPSSGLIDVNCEGCAGGGMQEGLLENMQIWRLAHPGGNYELDLGRPYHRALLRMIYRFVEKLGLDPNAACDIVQAVPAYSHPPKDAAGNFAIPSSGTVSLTVNLETLATGELSQASELDFSGMIKKYYNLLRQNIPDSKAVPFLGQWSLVNGQHGNQIEMLEALGKDFQLTCSQLMYLCEGHSLTTDVLWRLLPCVVPGANTFHVTQLMLTASIEEHIAIHNHMVNYRNFNADNPTGHYTLRLDTPGDYGVAEKLLLLDRWEAGISRRQDRLDISQRENYSRIRNERYQHKPLVHVASLAEWFLPEWDVLELDYVTGKRPAGDCLTLDARTFRSFLIHLHQSGKSGCTSQNQVEALRRVSHCFFLTTFQLRELLGCFGDRLGRIEIFVMFYLRIVDIWNEKVVRSRFDRQEDVDEIRARLGSCILFPYIQPEHMSLTYDLSQYDQRLAMHMLLLQVNKERPPNKVNPFKECVYVHPDGSVDSLQFGLPRLWEQFDRMPQEGSVSCLYSCAPEHRKFEDRCQLLERYGAWSPPAAQDQVCWWAATKEIPADVVDFLHFLVKRFNNIWEAFVALDENGNKSLTLDEFQRGLQILKCKKFKRDRQNDPIRAVFRFLDAGEEGTVTEEEWGVLENLFSEVQLSIYEFVQFLLRTFDDDLSAARLFLDDNSDGELTKSEWACAMKSLYYFGPWSSVFNFLDKDGEGTIDLQEFNVLESYREPPQWIQAHGLQVQ